MNCGTVWGGRIDIGGVDAGEHAKLTGLAKLSLGPKPGAAASADRAGRAAFAAATGQQSVLNEVIDAGHHFFGGVSRGLAALGREGRQSVGTAERLYPRLKGAGGAFIGGLRYGDGTLYTKNAGDVRVYWQGPSLGFDAGADGARTMMVYNLPRTEAIFERFGGIAGSAYFVGGLGMTALTANDIVVVPIRSGVGMGLGDLGHRNSRRAPPGTPSEHRLHLRLKKIEIVTGLSPSVVVFVARRTISV